MQSNADSMGTGGVAGGKAGHGGGVQAGAGAATTVGKRGVATLGSLMATLEHPEDRTWPGVVGGGPRLQHDSNRSRRLAMASICEMLVGGEASLRAPT
jgi:hypothetical protein